MTAPNVDTGLGSVRRAELGMVEDVEELRAEFDIGSLRDVGLLEDREVEVVDSLLAERSIDTRFVAEGPRINLRARCRIDRLRSAP